MKVLAAAFIMALLFSLLAGTLIVGKVQAATDVSGIITSDTTWTKSNSPYALTGNILVNSEVTLTIEAGANVSLNSYYIQVDGTLVAKGSSEEKIGFNQGQIEFMATSNGWNEETGSGCIIENAILTSTDIFSSNSLKIDNSIITGRIFINSSTIISNSILGPVSFEGRGNSLAISNNIITGGVAPNSNIIDDLIAGKFSAGNAPTNEATTGIVLRGSDNEVSIIRNTISECSAGIKVATEGWVSIKGNQIFNNTVNGIEILCPVNLTIEGNSISNNTINQIIAKVGTQNRAILTIQNNTMVNGPRSMITGIQQSIYGINLEGKQKSNTTYISHNIISGCEVAIGPASGTIERNLVTNNNDAIVAGRQAIIRNNTIANNNRGIGGPYSSTTIIYNNIVNSSATGSIWMTNPEDVNATFNWWGTTDSQVISQGIILNPFYDDSVTFVPFLTEPNPHAMPDPNAPTSTPYPTTTSTAEPTSTPELTPTPTPTELNSVEIVMLISLIVIIALLVVIIVLLLKKRQ